MVVGGAGGGRYSQNENLMDCLNGGRRRGRDGWGG